MTKKILRGDRNQCPTCGEYFNSTKAFDRHRTGRFGVDRRCMTVVEMTARGMVLNKAGFWITERHSARSLKRKIATQASGATPDAVREDEPAG